MRVPICLCSRGDIYKLVCLNEDQKGIYLAWYEGFHCKGGRHFSYHSEGLRHEKEHPKAKPRNAHYFDPIDRIDGIAPLLAQYSPLEPGVIHRNHPVFRGDGRATATVVLPEGSLGTSYARLDFCVVNRGAVKELLDLYHRAKKHWVGHHLVRLEQFDLSHFPQHAVTVGCFAVHP